jgi:glutathione S-transferase
MALTLYTNLGSGNAYKAELLLHLLGLPYESVRVDLRRGEHREPAFLALNPLGQIPVLVDGDAVLTDSQAILLYLARKYGGETWAPVEALPLARVMRWLSIAANEIQNGPTMARAIKLLGWPHDYSLAVERGYRVLGIIDEHLRGREWIAIDRPTVADIACYPYLLLAPEGGLELDPYAEIRAWCRRLEALPRFWAMPRIPNLPPIPIVPSPHRKHAAAGSADL